MSELTKVSRVIRILIRRMVPDVVTMDIEDDLANTCEKLIREHGVLRAANLGRLIIEYSKSCAGFERIPIHEKEGE